MLAVAALALLQQASHLASFVQPSGKQLGARTFADADGDGDLDLYLATAGEDGKRYVDIHYQHQATVFSTSPDEHIEIPAGVVAWNVGDFLDGEENAGSELLLMAARGAYVRTSQGQPKLLARAVMLLDMPSSTALPLWPGMRDSNADGKPEVVLVTATGFEVIDSKGASLGKISLTLGSETPPVASGNYLGGLIRTTISSQELGDLFLPNEDLGVIARPPALFSDESLPTPVWVDANGDGLQDLSYLRGAELYLHFQGQDGHFPAEASQIIELPNSEDSDFEQIEWVDLGGGAAADLLLVRSSADVLRQTRPWQARVYLDLAMRESLQESDVFLKVDSTFLWVYFFDLNRDGMRDICLSNWSLDLGLLGTSAPKIEHQVTGFLSESGEWDTRAAFVWSRTFKVDDFESLVSMDTFVNDLTGDGQPNLLERSTAGSLEIRRFVPTSHGVKIADDIAGEIPINALQAEVEVLNLNSDGIGDFIISRDGKLEIHLSYRR
jgi:hypothetical protein